MPLNGPRLSFLARCPPENISLHATRALTEERVKTEDRSQFRAPSWKALQSSSHVDLVVEEAPSTGSYRYLSRSALNLVGPFALVGLYAFIVALYLLKPPENDVTPWRPVGSRELFFTWTVISVFVVDWAKSGLATLEAALLAKPNLWCPSSPQQLLWHADRSWGNLNGWARASHSLFDRAKRGSSHCPSWLWWYLCCSSLLLYTGIPLAGLALETRNTYRSSQRIVSAGGSNQTTFNLNNMNDVANSANVRWRDGQPITGEQASILYSTSGTVNASATYYEDAIQKIYQQDLSSSPLSNRTITFFTGPTTFERTYGSAWGLLTAVSCSPVNPRAGLKNMKVSSIDDWSGTPLYGQTPDSYYEAIQNYSNTNQFFMSFDSSWNSGIQYFLASDRPFSSQVQSDYTDASIQPRNGSIEVVMWQATLGAPDPSWEYVVNSPHTIPCQYRPEANATFYGFGVRCEVQSSTGFASLDAASRTHSRFQVSAATASDFNITQTKGMLAIESVVFSAFSRVILNDRSMVRGLDKLQCDPFSDGGGLGCGPWYGASEATNSVVSSTAESADEGSSEPRYEAMTPERLTLAMYKLFGAAAVAMMSAGPSEWTSSLQGLDSTSDLVQGLIPWQIPLSLLCFWAMTIIIPSFLVFGQPRFASTVGGFEMFRLGAEWKEAQLRESRARDMVGQNTFHTNFSRASSEFMQHTMT